MPADAICSACQRYLDRCRCTRYCEFCASYTNHTTLIHIEAVALLPEEP
jgi:hypothetical protein